LHGLEQAIEAFAIVARTDPEARLLLLGDGAELERLQRLTAALGIRDAVVFAGAKPYDVVPAYLAAMDATVVTARTAADSHSSPLKLREYLAAGRAVVAPRVGDVDRTVTDDVDALFYETGDVAGFAAQLLRLRNDRDLRARLGATGRRLALERCTRDAQLEVLVQSTAFRSARARATTTTRN
jgi:glycosyltransferase involved in cell wall biosynthesis